MQNFRRLLQRFRALQTAPALQINVAATEATVSAYLPLLNLLCKLPRSAQLRSNGTGVDSLRVRFEVFTPARRFARVLKRNGVRAAVARRPLGEFEQKR